MRLFGFQFGDDLLTDCKVDDIVEEGATEHQFSQEDLDAMCRDRGFHEWELAQTIDGVVEICLVCGTRAG